MSLFDLQKKQWLHDENYHRDILNLPVKDRVKHLCLHFSKYYGRLLEQKKSVDVKNIADILIVTLSFANVLNITLFLEERKDLLSGFDQLLVNFGIVIGRLAKACESLDHLENYPYHAEMIRNINEILTLSLAICRFLEINEDSIIHNRWDEIEKKSIFLKLERNKIIALKEYYGVLER